MKKTQKPSILPYAAAIRLLGGRDHSAHEIRTKLAMRGYEDEEIEETVEKLKADGYVDDTKFAAQVARSHATLGRRGLANQMRKRGIAEEHWQELVDAIDTDEERRRALQLSYKSIKPADTNRLDREVWQRRLAGYLQRRGFGFDTVMSVIKEREQE